MKNPWTAQVIPRSFVIGRRQKLGIFQLINEKNSGKNVISIVPGLELTTRQAECYVCYLLPTKWFLKKVFESINVSVCVGKSFKTFLLNNVSVIFICCTWVSTATSCLLDLLRNDQLDQLGMLKNLISFYDKKIKCSLGPH